MQLQPWRKNHHHIILAAMVSASDGKFLYTAYTGGLTDSEVYVAVYIETQ